MRRVMFDIETLDTKSTAVMLSIAAVEFDDQQHQVLYHGFIDIQSCIDKGLTISADTLLWWMNQSTAAKKIFTMATSPLEKVLKKLINRTDWKTVDECWANGSDFDFPIIANAFRACDLVVPWPYYKQRDYRTVRKLFSQSVLDELTVKPTVAHDAEADCIAQLLTLKSLSEHLSYVP